MAALPLLDWPDLRDAEAAVVAARADWARAKQRFRAAPHGQRESRLRALRDASSHTLRAELTLATLRREIGA